MIWIAATLAGAAAQTGRNMAQAGLTRSLGTLGATQVRFVYGLPFAILFLGLTCLVAGTLPPMPDARAFGMIALGAVAQIGATALMLATMARRSFALSTAWLKTEPVLIAIGGAVLLAEHLGAAQVAGVLIATAGVIMTGWKPRTVAGAESGGLAPVATGLAAAAGFGLSAIAFRAGIVGLGDGGYFLRAMTALALSLSVQVVLLALWLQLFHRGAMAATLRQWRGSLAAGFLGAFGSAMWFTAFALAPAAQVRTLALVEVLMAAALGWALRGERPSPRSALGMGVIVFGVAVLLAG